MPDKGDDMVTSGEVTMSLPSADKPLPFHVTLVVEAKCPEDPPPPALLDIANEGVARRAERLSGQYALTAADRLRGALSTALNGWHHVPGTGVLARGHCTSVDVDAELVAAVAAREEADRRWFAASWQDERRAQQAEQMRSRLLDPLRATAWWFLDHQAEPERLEDVARAFDKAREVLAPKDTPDSPGRLVDDMLAAHDPAVRTSLARYLERFFAEYSREDLVIRLKHWQEDNEEL
ncbi:hypothetical protein [Saccharothrix sp. NRRL B-16348]|uniref:hypothetical protein n=1 Tax=Saccharothrix sp. NRRL B-16348 TaxID=1415542 RepID=UPI0018D0363C|nr:hypothetical protein [Saccharothrix sp. NRRL B-16348]